MPLAKEKARRWGEAVLGSQGNSSASFPERRSAAQEPYGFQSQQHTRLVAVPLGGTVPVTVTTVFMNSHGIFPEPSAGTRASPALARVTLPIAPWGIHPSYSHIRTTRPSKSAGRSWGCLLGPC